MPAFPAVYGGAIQMFGRAYRGGATRDLALPARAANVKPPPAEVGSR